MVRIPFKYLPRISTIFWIRKKKTKISVFAEVVKFQTQGDPEHKIQRKLENRECQATDYKGFPRPLCISRGQQVTKLPEERRLCKRIVSKITK